jgi:hypothetical protein
MLNGFQMVLLKVSEPRRNEVLGVFGSMIIPICSITELVKFVKFIAFKQNPAPMLSKTELSYHVEPL